VALNADKQHIGVVDYALSVRCVRAHSRRERSFMLSGASFMAYHLFSLSAKPPHGHW